MRRPNTTLMRYIVNKAAIKKATAASAIDKSCVWMTPCSM
jgi:hypothetical protein